MIYTLEQIKQKAKPILENYGVDKAYIFGSYANGLASENSDIDILLVKGQLKSLLQLSALQFDLSEAFNKKVDIVTESALNSNLNKLSQQKFKAIVDAERILFYG